MAGVSPRGSIDLSIRIRHDAHVHNFGMLPSSASFSGSNGILKGRFLHCDGAGSGDRSSQLHNRHWGGRDEAIICNCLHYVHYPDWC